MLATDSTGLLWLGAIGGALLLLLLLAGAVWAGAGVGRDLGRNAAGRELQTMETINLITGALANLFASHPDEAIARMLEDAMRGLDARGGCVFLSAGPGCPLRLIHSRGVSDPAAVYSAVSSQFIEQVAVQTGSVAGGLIEKYPALEALGEDGRRAFAAGLFGRARGWRGLLLMAWSHAQDAEDALPALKQICSFAGQALAEYEIQERRAQDFVALSAQLQKREADYQIAATCVHDAVHPMQNVIGVVFSATGEDGSARLSPEAIREIEESVSLAGNILKGATANEEQLDGELLRVGQLLEMVPNLVSSINGGKPGGGNLRFEMDVSQELPTILGNRVSLVRVLNNLLTNAAKYNVPNGSIRLTVRRDKRHVVFEVANSGPAIPAGDLRRLFDYGYRVKEHAVQAEGRGIGLYSCKQIVQRHKGQIWAASANGINLFAFSIPITGATDDDHLLA